MSGKRPSSFLFSETIALMWLPAVFPNIRIGIGAALGAAIVAYFVQRTLVAR